MMRSLATAKARRNAWWVFPAVMAPISSLYLFGPRALNGGFVFNVIGLSAVVAIVGGVRMHRPISRGSWYLFAVGQTLFVAGDVLAYNYHRFFGGELPFPSVADPFYLAVYPSIIAGLLILIRHRNPGRDWASLIDSLIIATGLGLLSWIFLMAPYAHDSNLSTSTKLVSIAYPLMDTLVLSVAVRLAVGRGRRGPSYYLMITSVVALLVTDTIYGWLLLHGGYTTGGLLDGGWIAFYLLWGSAALHPSMASVSEATAERRPITRKRLLALALATSIAPIAQMIKSTNEGGTDTIVIAGAAIVLFILVVLRMVSLVREQEATAKRERALREAGAALVTATNSVDIVHAAQEAAHTLAGPQAASRVFQVVDRGGERVLASQPDPKNHASEIEVRLSSLPGEALERLERRVGATIGDGSLLIGRNRPRSAFIAPLMSRGTLVGAIIVSGEGHLAPATTTVIESLALQVGLALESAALTENLLRAESEARFSALVQHSSDVILVLDPDTTIQYVSPSVRRVLGHLEAQLTGRRLFELIEDSDRLAALKAITRLAAGAPLGSDLLEFRVRNSDGTWVDVETLVTNLLETPGVGGIVMNVRDITERKRFEEQLTHQAFHDPVTGLANRALFRDRVKHGLSVRRDRGRSLAVLLLDLDDFKTINDTFGHLVGDELLRNVAVRISDSMRAGDTAARLGGDEFAILVEDVTSETDVVELADRLLETLRSPQMIEGTAVSIQSSVGIVMASGSANGGAAVEELLRNADVAMYMAKDAGKGSYKFFESEMHSAVVERLALRATLATAIENNELTLAYQPIVKVDTGVVFGIEALLRWNDPLRGNISPDQFIPVAEESGLIVPLGKWVLDRACMDAVALQRKLGFAPDLVVSVNLSARQLQRAEIVDEVRDAIETSGLRPESLVLEITESMVMTNLDLAILRLADLRGLGVRIALDDFGKGHSSLNHIRELPINILKIDKSFVDDIDTDDAQKNLTAAIIELAHVLNLVSIAEGVERADQLQCLKELCCEYTQGFLFSAPLRLEDLEAMLEGHGTERLAA